METRRNKPRLRRTRQNRSIKANIMINKLVFNKTTSGNYLVTLEKVNKRDELASREILLVSGRS